MRVTTIEHYTPEPGEVIEWSATPATRAAVTTAARSPIPPSFNQRFHFETARRRDPGPGTWLALAFDLPGRVDPAVLHDVFEYWLRRHETLRSGFHARTGEIERFVLPPERVALDREHLGEFPTADGLRAHLRGRLDAVCRPTRDWPSSLLAAILRPDRSTVFCGFDHRDVDGYSLAIAVHELQELYRPGSAELPEPGSFLDFCAAEQADPVPDPEHEVVRAWDEFLAACGGTPPAFPLELGVEPGQPVAQAADCRPLLDAGGAAEFERACRALGGSMFTGVLTATGLAARRLGAGGVVRLLTPMHTRTDPRWENAIGWLTTVAPMALDVRSGRFSSALPLVHREFREALDLGRVRAPLVLAALGPRFRRGSDDVFMVSYTDYRRFPGSARHVEANAQHISNVTVADDAQFWVSRTHEGLFLRSRYPGTDLATRQVTAFTDTLARLLAVPG
ncbi:condensation domain-containing protein [Amycolatopsis cihanbeyliensis]|uniref:Condensation domain-containing protein n=1 Tax=Amycolatopsis cihanbeyliensis TaxID=1128664 RepID=A0A542DGA1_AMYCI|nr:condensation domain-containing protein [Amycolatopsis cihanbeyliensis]TQJ02105.1 condensation domain-containing protein [Amycolatopsis cihanbeyliensis]